MALNKFSRISTILANRSYFTYSNQISQPISRTPPYSDARKAVECIKSGKTRLIACNKLWVLRFGFTCNSGKIKVVSVLILSRTEQTG